MTFGSWPILLILSPFAYMVLRWAWFASNRAVASRRTPYIDSYVFPEKVRNRVLEVYPHLTDDEVDRVLDGLREYFHICNNSAGRMVSMPSQVVDVAWHEFILFTRKYADFCQRALGRFLHHTPAEAMNSAMSAEAGLKRAWRLSCAREGLRPKNPIELPLLFKLDRSLKIPDGFMYERKCNVARSPAAGPAAIYCASHIGCAAGCAGAAGASGGFGIGGDGSSDGDGCGGDGCGGCGGD